MSKKETHLIMGMPITVEIVDTHATKKHFQKIFDYFHSVDATFSTYKTTSEISRYQRGELLPQQLSTDMKEILRLAEETRDETQGYFSITHDGKMDPSGIVKGWAIQNAAKLLWQANIHHFFIDAGGDIQVSGMNHQGKSWSIGIRNPFAPTEIVKVIKITNQGVATSGTYMRGNHIYNPHNGNDPLNEIASITVIGSNVYEADRFATAAFAMGRDGISFINDHKDLEGYLIDSNGIATYTEGFTQFLV